MNRAFAYRDQIAGTYSEAIAYQDSRQKETVIVIAEMKEQPGPSFEKNRVNMVEELSKDLKTTPDKVAWYERNGDGSYSKCEFKAELKHDHRHMTDTGFSEAEATKDGVPKTIYYSLESKVEVNPEYLKGRIKDDLREPITYQEHYRRSQKVEQTPLVLPERPANSEPWRLTPDGDDHDR